MPTFRFLLVCGVALLGCKSGPYEYYVPTHPSTIQSATYAQDHSNWPDYSPAHMDLLKTYDYVSLSPRAQAIGGPVGGDGNGSNGNESTAAEQLIAAGVKVLFVTFPCYFHYLNQPLPEGDIERDIEELAISYNATLHKANDPTQFQIAYGCFVLDFRNRPFVDALVNYWHRKAKIGNGILLHEACGGVPTEDQFDPYYYPTPTQEERDFEDGYHYYVSGLRRGRPDWEVIAVCDRWESNSPHAQWRPDLFDGLFFENVYNTGDNAVALKMFNQASQGTRDVVALYDVNFANLYPNIRRGAAAIAIMRDALFVYGEESSVTHDIEHFQMDYGTFSGPPTETSLGSGVWVRIGTRGLVVLNISGTTYDYVDPIYGQHYMLGTQDGLSLQFKDQNDNYLDPLSVKTNYGL